MTEKPTGAQLIASTFKNLGVSHVFYMDAILRRALMEMEFVGIKRILTHSEKTAAYMADGYARAGRRLGICMSQSVGAANLASGLQDAYLAKSSVIAMTGRQPSHREHRNTHQEIDHEPLFSAVTKLTARVDSVEEWRVLFNQAVALATSGSPRPVHLDLKGHTGDMIAGADATGLQPLDIPLGFGPAFRPAANPREVERAIAAIAAARKPAIVMGNGAVWSDAGEAVRQMSQKIGAGIVASMDAKALLPDFEPGYAGVIGMYSRESANRVAAEADLFIYAGCDTGDWITGDWLLPKPETVPVIQIDPDPAEIGKNYIGAIGIQADVKLALEALTAAAPATRRDEWFARIAEIVDDFRKKAEPLRTSDGEKIRPERLLAELETLLTDDAFVVVDTGHASSFSASMLYLTKNQSYIRTSGSLGWALPASLGVQCAHPDKMVVCFTGDGGALYHLSELETAKRYGLNTIIIVNNNGRLQQAKKSYQHIYDGRNGNSEELYSFAPVDYSAVAQAFGCFGIRVKRPEEFADAFMKARQSGLPAVLDVLIDEEAMPPAPWTPTELPRYL